jgi:hypothetical protein
VAVGAFRRRPEPVTYVTTFHPMNGNVRLGGIRQGIR